MNEIYNTSPEPIEVNYVDDEISFYHKRQGFTHKPNMNELANKMKVWAFNKGYSIKSWIGCSGSRYCWHGELLDSNSGTILHKNAEHSEFDAVTGMCYYVLKREGEGKDEF